ncbi:hypothetical protein D3C75_1041080 [compost metagenome]
MVTEPPSMAWAAESWVQPAWRMSPTKFSAAIFQLHSMVERMQPPTNSVPPSSLSRMTSRYQAIGPRYSARLGASSAKVANTRPL